MQNKIADQHVSLRVSLGWPGDIVYAGASGFYSSVLDGRSLCMFFAAEQC